MKKVYRTLIRMRQFIYTDNTVNTVTYGHSNILNALSLVFTSDASTKDTRQVKTNARRNPRSIKRRLQSKGLERVFPNWLNIIRSVVLAYIVWFSLQHNANATIRTSTRKRKNFDTCDCVYPCAYACVESVFTVK